MRLSILELTSFYTDNNININWVKTVSASNVVGIPNQAFGSAAELRNMRATKYSRLKFPTFSTQRWVGNSCQNWSFSAQKLKFFLFWLRDYHTASMRLGLFGTKRLSFSIDPLAIDINTEGFVRGHPPLYLEPPTRRRRYPNNSISHLADKKKKKSSIKSL